MTKRTYLDANVLIAAWQAKDPLGTRAMAILDDPQRQLMVSDAVWLEVKSEKGSGLDSRPYSPSKDGNSYDSSPHISPASNPT
ncbi:hypothetical protein D5125_17250 [Magnetovirga frankeli]|uniref:hypothetical protein n=1 Tax=Magnetovirga frankeli TaxID=947516 RepID=UPI001AF57F29|nr:hypothetical protein D5125_17250 [gamma proteobacterium SS-5]